MTYTSKLSSGLLVCGEMFWLRKSGVGNAVAWVAVCAWLVAGTGFSGRGWAAEQWTGVDIGGGVSGGEESAGGGWDLRGAGRDVGGSSDQFRFLYQEREGDFDVRVRVEDLTMSDPFAQAGLVARAELVTNAPFAGVFASSPRVGSFFEWRGTAGGQSQTAAPAGGFPVNYPQTWLRLKRSGNQWTGFGSVDGEGWQQLHTTSVSMPARVLFGMALASHASNVTATARFRDLGPVMNPGTFSLGEKREPLGPSNRRTGLIFSELMYHPRDREDGRDLEFIEIYNAESVFVDLTGWRLAGAVRYEFPKGFKLPSGEFAVIAADPAALEAVMGIRGVLGPYEGRLNNAGDTLRLHTAADAIRLEVEYSPDAPWPVAADGAGHSLALARPSYGENDARAWGASARAGGSPGEVDPIIGNPWAGVVINEFLAHTDDPQLDFVELYNSRNEAVDISGCYLSDEPATNRFRIPPGTIVPGRGYLVFDQNQLGFSLDAAGETIYFVSADERRVLDAARFGGQEKGVSFGRTPDGGLEWERLAKVSAGEANAGRREEAIVIHELMYHPISKDDRDQYIELHNRMGTELDLSGWRFVAGVEFAFPAGARIPGGGHVVVAKDKARLRAAHSHLNEANSFGDFEGALSRSGERLALAKPDLVISTNAAGTRVTNTIHIVVSEVTYGDGGRWPELADGGGSSLELKDARADLDRASNWAASDESKKGRWTPVEYTGRMESGNSGQAANRFFIALLGAGDCLVDDLEVFRVGSTNLLANGGFENGTNGWRFFGHHRASQLAAEGAFAGAGALRVRAPGDGDTGNNSIRANLTSTLTSGQTVTIRAKVRWLAGWPEVLFRVRGNGIELPARMEVPGNLGTPGLPNSRGAANAGPAIYDVVHHPALPRANEAVLVTCRITDPDGVAFPRVRFRVDPSTSLSTAGLRDDGAGGDAVAGDGLYSARISGRPAGTLIAFRVEAGDDASPSVASLFPEDAPARECLIRWEDPIPFGTFAHYHMWNTAATDQARAASRALDNTYRDCTLVYGDYRVVYNAGFRDKGSPYHGGSGDYAVTVPSDDLLLGASDRVFGSTGNGGNESTGMRGDISAWIGQQLGIPYLHSHYMRLYRNGSRFREVLYDLEQPNRDYARSWFGEGDRNDDLFKVAIWFEFDDSNGSFSTTGASLQRFLSNGAYPLGRYRWNWQPRPSGNTANDYAGLFNIITAANSATEQTRGLLNLADIEQWMRVFAFNRILGNWDSFGFNLGQNMYLFTPLGRRAVLLPWDIDFVLGDGNGTTDPLWGASDPIINQLFAQPVYRRMLWRAYQDAINGPLLPENYNPQIDARRAMLLKNGVTGLSDPRSIKTYIDGRRNHIQRQLLAADSKTFTILNNGGQEFSTGQPVVSLSGTAPFAVESIEINGVPYAVTWTNFTTWRIQVPLGAAENRLSVVGRDLRGEAVAGAEASIVVRFTGEAPRARDWVVINEIMYNAREPDAQFIELHNRHPSVPFDLTGRRLGGVDFTFPPGVFIPASGYVVAAQDRAAFAGAYGAQIAVAGEFPGRLDNNGERLRLIKPGPVEGEDEVIDEVRYESSLPWPVLANGRGPSLQLIDAAQDNTRPGNWTATAADDPSRATPGRANAGRGVIEPFPLVWINEVLPNNATGARDGQGEVEPWLELYNAGSAPVVLEGLYLSDDPANLLKWSFPAGASLGAGQFLTVWADGEANETAPGSLHTSFRLASNTGTVALSRLQGGAAAAMDAVSYHVTAADRAFGSWPDGEARGRRLLYFPTPGAPNNGESPVIPVFINEWMASNRSILADPADGGYDDWFEVYNAGSEPVDLSGFYLTGNLADKTRFRIPDGTVIAAGGFRLFWADDEVNQNQPGRDVHTNFRLPASGGVIGLFGADERQVDSVEFGGQTADVSEGRFPDGGSPPFPAFTTATPGAANRSDSANRPPALAPVLDRTIREGDRLEFKVSATDPDLPAQRLRFALVNPPEGAVIGEADGQFIWTPSESQGPGAFAITVRVTDDGAPARSVSGRFFVFVQEVNAAPRMAPLADFAVDEGERLSFRAEAGDPDLPAQRLIFSLDAGAPEGAAIDPVTGEFTWTPQEEHGPSVYSIRVRVTDAGEPAMTDAQTTVVTVREVNNPPVVAAVPPQAVDEGTTLRVEIAARDSDNPPAPLTFILEAAPEGAVLDGSAGIFTWTPTEAQGPRDHNVTIRVSEPGGSPSTVISFLAGVREVNTAPELQPIPDAVARPGDRLEFSLRASDADLPEQTLTFTPVNALPSGAELDGVTGSFRWLVPRDPAIGVFPITVRVTDDEVPPLFAERTFVIRVDGPRRVAINEILHRPATPNAEFVELMNYSAAGSVDLSGWRLEGYGFTFPPGTILGPLEYLCVARDVGVFRAAYGDAARVAGNASVDLPREGGRLRLWQPGSGGQGETLADEVMFELRAPWPEAAWTEGASLQLIDPWQDHRRVGNWAAAVGSATNAPAEVLAMNASWKYWQNSAAPGADWASASFNDGTWPSGRALHYVESAALPGPKNTALTLGRTTYYFRGRFNFAGNPEGARLRLTTIIDDGAVFYLNGREVHRLGMPGGAVTGATFANRTAGDAILEGPFDVPALGLRAGENVLAVEVHQVNATSSDVVFGTSAAVAAVSSARFTPGSANAAARELEPFPLVWLNEILPNNTAGIADNAGDRDPWIEIYNDGAGAARLDGWALTDDLGALGKWGFPSDTTVAGKGYLLVWADGEAFENAAGHLHTAFRLAPSNGVVALSRFRQGKYEIVDYLNYTGAALAPSQSYGSVADGEPLGRRALEAATPGGNNASGGPEGPVIRVEFTANGGLRIVWRGETGFRYRLEAAASLPATRWEMLSELDGIGGEQFFTEPTPLLVQRFFRVTKERKP